MCDSHEGAPVTRAEDLPLTSKFRPLRDPDRPRSPPFPVGLILFPLMLIVTPLLTALTGGSPLGALLVPVFALTAVYLVVRGRRG